MSSSSTPHFLRVVRALARVSSVSIPAVTVVISTTTAGCTSYDGVPLGLRISSTTGAGGAGTGAGGARGAGTGAGGAGGYDGIPLGLTAYPAAAGAGGASGYDGGPVGLPVYPDAGGQGGDGGASLDAGPDSGE